MWHREKMKAIVVESIQGTDIDVHKYFRTLPISVEVIYDSNDIYRQHFEEVVYGWDWKLSEQMSYTAP